MALHYLSGDDMARKKKKDKKNGKKKIVKIAAAPARAAFITLVTLNLFKLGTKLAKLWNKDKQSLIDLWEKKFGGDTGKLKEAIIKGSKTSISGDECDDIGVAPEAIMAAALPIVIALIPLLKKNSIPDEGGELDSGVVDGKKELTANPDVYSSRESAPLGFDLKYAFSGGWLNIVTNIFLKFLCIYLPAIVFFAKDHPIIFSITALIGALDMAKLIRWENFSIDTVRLKEISSKIFSYGKKD